ncbi:unnamed protein product [Hymenolepis diminuta]|uniref:SET domain-containing protein n=1 Tax=Hymenolepis diminuta TaxID=6216 RepID=A0A3P6ZK78_HYMDI|nr:unnamed protein product [Hymenolepis diminuta]
MAEARMHMKQVFQFYNRLPHSDLLERAIQGIAKCDERSESNELLEAYHSEWQCHRSELPILKRWRKNRENVEGPEFESSGHSPLVPLGLLHLKNAGPLGGWTMVVTRNVSVGEVLLLDKAYAMSLYSERTTYCYTCYKRCHNLLPCSGCPHVGFCSEKCAKEVVNPDRPSDGRKHAQPHLYDCQGVLACFCSSINEDLLHAAFKCISNTTPECLLDYCCSTGKYRESGRGHQAFVGAENVRNVPPLVFDSTDYSSVAWLSTCSDKMKDEDLWRYTLNALFLTYCFHIGGYPMMWFDEFDKTNESLFFSAPSASNRPVRIPASWLAACLLFHIQANDVNNFEFGEVVFKSKKYFPQSQVSLGSCLFPSLSLINHSCEPSAAICVTDKGRAFLYALQPISAGDQITISYGPSLLFMDKCNRQRKLENCYYFTCNCEVCENNWNLETPETERIKKLPRSGRHFSISLQIYSILSHEWFPWLEEQYIEGNWTLENLKASAKCVELAYKVLGQPSLLLSQFKQIFKIYMHTLYGLYTIEPWIVNN